MFARARRRLTAAYIVVFVLVFGLFSLVFYVGLTIVLAPDFDFGPEPATDADEQATYRAALDRIGLALLIADGVAVIGVGGAAWVLAERTLRPIREAHERQRRFVADASHELRTPVAAIRTGSEAALKRATSAEDLRTALNDVLGSTERLTRITNDLLVLARTDDQTVDHRRARFDLSVVVAEAIETERAALGKRPTELRLEPDLVVDADADEVARIVRNLIENAFVHGGPSVSVSTRGTAREAIVEVRDDGPGIPAADREHVFDPFYRGRRDAAGAPGSGLGLAIAADLARRNQGALSLESGSAGGVVARLTVSRAR